MNDMWSLVSKGDKVAFWCMGSEETTLRSKKRAHDGDSQETENQPPKKSKSATKIDSQRELVREYELELKKKHEGVYSPFQYKLWAEMYANGGHVSLEEPPAVAMFNREKHSKSSHGNSDVMVTVIDRLCTALTPKDQGKTQTLSPMRKAELRSTYIKQLGELKLLNQSGVLTENEFEEQREELVELMRELKNKD